MAYARPLTYLERDWLGQAGWRQWVRDVQEVDRWRGGEASGAPEKASRGSRR